MSAQRANTAYTSLSLTHTAHLRAGPDEDMRVHIKRVDCSLSLMKLRGVRCVWGESGGGAVFIEISRVTDVV